MRLNCKQCGGRMKKKKVSKGNASGIAGALIVFIIGAALCFTIIGAIIGVPMMIVALFMGGDRQKVWMCRACRSVVERA